MSGAFTDKPITTNQPGKKRNKLGPSNWSPKEAVI